MKILLVNTSDNTGGAAVAASRLMNALQKSGAEVSMLVRDKGTDDERVERVRQPWLKRIIGKILPGGDTAKAIERLRLLVRLGFHRDNLWTVDDATHGTDITRLQSFRDADVIHLHWINQGMLSLNDLRKIMTSGKRIVWTMHDLWPATAVCHYAHDCNGFTQGFDNAREDQPSSQQHPCNTSAKTCRDSAEVCRDCHLFDKNSSYPSKVWQRKRNIYEAGRDAGSHITFVGCSRWIASEARRSSLLQGFDVTAIPNPIDISRFNRRDKQAARAIIGLPSDQRIILFVSQKVTDERKGAPFFIRAINQMADADEHFRRNTMVAILGSHGDELASGLHIKSHILGYLTDQERIISAYCSADTFVLPTLQDNLPNTIMEAMACGVPCVGYNVGGVPEMIDHKENGYIAEPRDINCLCEGIAYCLDATRHPLLSDACLEKVRREFSEESVAKRFMALYQA